MGTDSAGLRNMLDEKLFVTHVFRLSKKFAPFRLETASREISDRFCPETEHIPESIDLDELRQRIANVLRNGQSPDILDRATRNHSPWVIFFPPGKRRSWLGLSPELTNLYLKWLKQKRNSALTARMLQSFLQAYPIEDETFTKWIATLTELVALRRSGRLRKWHERVERYGLLSRQAPERVAKQILESPEKVVDILDDVGLTGQLGVSMFMRAVQTRVLEGVHRRLASANGTVELLERLDHFCAFDTHELRFYDLAHEIADSLLKPFVSSAPDPIIRQKIQELLLRYLGHPTRREGPWSRVDKNARQLFRRWVVGATLLDFFDLIREVALDRHWKYRQQFWMAFHEAGYIDDAWIVLGPDARYAGKKFVRENDGLFGKLHSGFGAESNHSALIFKVGTYTVTEWSHNGRCRVWRRGNERAPALGNNYYGRNMLMWRADKEFTHYHSEYGSWQHNVADWFKDEIGITVDPSEYLK